MVNHFGEPFYTVIFGSADGVIKLFTTDRDSTR